MSPSHLDLPDGAVLAYDLLGIEHLGNKCPLVLVGGVSSIRGDWERLCHALAQRRPLLVYDHRGMGDSKYSTPARDDVINIESLARDLLFLIDSLGWKQVDVCGFSMGGVILQQLLLLPYHPIRPTPVEFKVGHAILAATLPSVFTSGQSVFYLPPQAARKLSLKERNAVVRATLESMFDPAWVAQSENKERLKWWLDRGVTGRPGRTIAKQTNAVHSFDFGDLHSMLPRDTQFLIIHGELDAVVPFASGLKLLRLIPWARMVGKGSRRGEVPHYRFGHQWMEYFEPQVWHGVMDVFLDGETDHGMAKL